MTPPIRALAIPVVFVPLFFLSAVSSSSLPPEDGIRVLSAQRLVCFSCILILPASTLPHHYSLVPPVCEFLFLLSFLIRPHHPSRDGVRLHTPLSPSQGTTTFDSLNCLPIHLTGPIARVILTLEVENSAAASDASQVLLAFTPWEVKHLAFVKATRVEGKHRRKAQEPLRVEPSDLPATPNGARLYSALLSTHLKPGEATTLEVLYVLTHVLDPYPAGIISQSEPNQLVYYHDSAVLLSPYHVLEQVTYIKMPSDRIECFTKVDPTSRAGAEMKYGTYYDQMPVTYLPVSVHYENRPFAVIKKLERKVDVPRRGHIKVTDQYEMKQDGAWYKRIFLLLAARILPHSLFSSSGLECPGISQFAKTLPSSSKDQLYFTLIQGPRYGWHCMVEDFAATIVLPEGSKNPQPIVPFPIKTSYSYLYYVAGRAKVVLKKKNIVGEHSVPFQVYYESNPMTH